jgi:predicted DNA-binding protein
MAKKAGEGSVEELLEREALASESNPDAPLKPGTKVSRGHARSKVYSIRLNADEVQQVEQMAARLGLPASTMVRSWIVERLAADSDTTIEAVVRRLERDVSALRSAAKG